MFVSTQEMITVRRSVLMRLLENCAVLITAVEHSRDLAQMATAAYSDIGPLLDFCFFLHVVGADAHPPHFAPRCRRLRASTRDRAGGLVRWGVCAFLHQHNDNVRPHRSRQEQVVLIRSVADDLATL